MERGLSFTDKGMSGEGGYSEGNQGFRFGRVKSEISNDVCKVVGHITLELYGQVRAWDRTYLFK